MKVKKMLSLILFFFLGLLSINLVSAQGKLIKGKVIDENKEALIGVNVLIKGSDLGTTTGLSGEFSIESTMENITLVFSYVGYKTKEVQVKNELILLVSLASDLTTLSEVVVIGYGTQKKSDLTGSVVSLSKERLSQLPNANFAQALQGSVPGLQINTNSGGSEGNELSILIRGRNSINAGNGPLIILDGIPYVGGISEINPSDIESIEVLKDASAAAIYGSRGSNGIILITTKRGSKEKVSITYDGFYGIQQIARRPDLLTGEEFYNFKTTRINSPGTITQTEKEVYESGKFVDWYDLATRQGSRGQHSLSISGGSEKASFYLGATYLDVSGIAVNDDFKRYTLRPNLDVEVTPWLKIGSSSQLSFQDRTGLPVEFSDSRNTGGGANFFNPLTKPYNQDGSIAIYAWPEYNQARNPLSPLLVDNYDYGYRVFSANYAEIKLPLKGLTYKFNTGIEFEANDRKTYYGRNTAIGFQSGGTAETYHSIEKNLTVENILNYSKTFGNHSLNFTGLYSSQSNVFDRDDLEGQNFPSDVLTNYQMSSALLLQPSSTYFKQNVLSQMIRINYGFNSKYLLTMTARRDGFSGFGSGTKYGVFPSASLGWNVHKENFMRDLSFVSQFKFRASYGLNGNQAVGSYQSLARLSYRPYLNGTTILAGYLPVSLANPDLGWESTKSLNIGLDFGFFEGKIQGSIDYYQNRTFDLLLNRTISPTHGINSILQNIGETQNNGIELGINSTNIDGPQLKWTTGFNISHNKNAIVDLYGDGKDDLASRWFIGQPIRVNYNLLYDGIFKSQEEIKATPWAAATDKPGYVKVVDVNGDNLINALDRTIIGQLDPKLIWGLTNTFSHKGFTLMIFIHGQNGVTKENPLQLDNVFTDVARNTINKDWWSADKNPNGTHFANDANANYRGVNFYENASFLRIKDISLAYNFSNKGKNPFGVQSSKLYFTARNLATLTKYEGLDPEFTNQYGIPLQREWLVGLTVGF